MATVHMQYRNDGFAMVSNMSGIIQISAPTWRAKRWATKQLKMKAAAFGISLKKRNGAWYADQQKMQTAEYRLFEALEKCWVSPKVRDLRGGVILDKGF